MRLQLILASLLLSSTAYAQSVVQVDTAHTLYLESPTRTNMTVYTPGIDLAATPFTWMTVKGGYEADVVSGASVAVKAGSAYQSTNPGVDVVTTATSERRVATPRSGGLVRSIASVLTAVTLPLR